MEKQPKGSGVNPAMPPIHKIVLTGGPCGNKSSFMLMLREAFEDQIAFLREQARAVLEQDFFFAGKAMGFNSDWRRVFQKRVGQNQLSGEELQDLFAMATGKVIVVCDRAFPDGAAYLSGFDELLEIVFPNLSNEEKRQYKRDMFSRYSAVIHFVSLAVLDPVAYKRKRSSDKNLEGVEEAIKLDKRLQEIWSAHPNHHIIHGNGMVEQKQAEAMKIIREYLPKPQYEG